MSHARIPITLLTGFLGAGKTTVLNHLLTQPEMADAAVLINEFGAVAVDHHLVEKIDEDLMLLDSGCICCTVRTDLTRSLTELFMRCLRRQLKPIRRVVIETTGLADPAPVIYTLLEDPFIAERYVMDGVLTVVDMSHIAQQLAQHDEAVKQVVMADRLLLSKTDQTDPAQSHNAAALLRRLNPAAQQLPMSHGRIGLEAIINCGLYDPHSKSPDVATWLAQEKVREQQRQVHGHHHHHDVDRHDAHVHSFALTFDKPLHWGQFIDALSILLQTLGDKILRIKGLVNVLGDSRPRIVHCVQHTYYPSTSLEHWPDTPPYQDRKTRLVFIVRDLQPALVEQAFVLFCNARDQGEASGS